MRSLHRLCGAVAYTVQSACLAKSWGRGSGRATAISATSTGSGTGSATVTVGGSSNGSGSGSPAITPKCGVLSNEVDAKEAAFLSQLLFGLLLSVRQQVEQQGPLEQLYVGTTAKKQVQRQWNSKST